MRTRTLWRSFAGGEVTPELLGRVDLDKFVTGAITCRNCVVLPHGPVANRAGTQYVLEAKDSTHRVRIIPFTFNSSQTFILELGHQYARVHTVGATLLETPKTIIGVTAANPGIVTTSAAHGFATDDWIRLNNIGGPAALNNRYYKAVVTSATQFSFKDLWGTAISTLSMPAYVAGGDVSRVYTIATPYDEADLFDIHFDQSGDIITLVHPDYEIQELTRVSATTWTITAMAAGASIAAPTSVNAANTGAGIVTYSYVVTSVSEGGAEESIASTSDSCTNDLNTAGNFNTITFVAATGAVRYNVYKQRNGLYGYIGQTDALSFVDDNITPDVLRTPPETNDPYGATDDYPAAVAHWDQRRMFAGTNNRPQTFGASCTGTESNFNFSLPQRPNDAFFARIANEKNRILHLVPAGDMLALTAGSEQKIYSQDTDVLTPDSVGARKQTEYGASNVQPVVTGNNVLYVQSGGSKVREIQYDDTVQRYASADLTLLAPHLLADGMTVVDIAYARTPIPTLWAVRSDGALLGCTYVPEQKVFAWHRHDTTGFFESVAVVREGTDDILYVVVKRTVNARTVRYIERLPTRSWAALENAYHVDAGLTYSGSAATILSGLWHLEGQTVSILSNGAVEPQQAVVNGTVTLSSSTTLAHVGLPFVSDVSPTPVILQTSDGGISYMKNLGKTYLKVVRTSGMFAGPDLDTLRDALLRYDEAPGDPPAWHTGTIEIDIDPTWALDGEVYIRQTDPLPMLITAVGVEVEVAPD